MERWLVLHQVACTAHYYTSPWEALYFFDLLLAGMNASKTMTSIANQTARLASTIRIKLYQLQYL